MKLSERLARQQRVQLDVAPLRTALRELRQTLESAPYHTKLYIERLAKDSTIATAVIERGDDGTKVIIKPARALAAFLRQAERAKRG